jgi:ubiquinone/menaquinone biosynthesis C-methylase UbiE
VRGDALDPPFADGAFDYAITSMFLHHLSDDDAVKVLRNMDRVARRGIVAADLLRHPSAYAWISLFTVASNRLVKHDARASVRQAFDPDEVLACATARALGTPSTSGTSGIGSCSWGKKTVEPNRGMT